MSDGDTLTDRVLEVLREADEPLSAGRIQRRLAGEGFDATTGAVRDACRGLVEGGSVTKEGTPPEYRAVD